MYQVTFFHRIVAIVMIVSILQSCSYYKFRTLPDGGNKESTEWHVNKRPAYKNYYIVHQGDEAYQINSVDVTQDSIKGTIGTMNAKVKQYMLSAYEGGRKRVPKADLKYINQLHFFVDSIPVNNNKVAIAISDVERLDAMNMNAGLKVLTVTTGAVVGSAAALGLFILIVCNCPHTYVFDGDQYYFNNTLFTGATSEKLERHDYKIMPDYVPDSDQYHFFIRNDENEQQFTNLLELIVVQHEESVDVSMDQAGNIYTLAETTEPTIARDNSGNDLMNLVSYADDVGHMFDNESPDKLNSVLATFKKPINTKNAKIVLNVKNHQWGGLVYNEFSKLFGKYYDNWVKQNHKKSKEEVMGSLKKAGIPLTVSVKKSGQWVELEDIDLVGSVNYNSLVIPVDADLLTDETIEVRLQSGFMFWELDRINMDFSAPGEKNVQRLAPKSATGSEDRDDTASLTMDDDQYMEHLATGDSTFITFEGIQNMEGKSRTIYLHSKGYYLPQEEFAGKLQRKELAKINQQGGLSIFSRELFEQLFETTALNPEK